MKKSYEIRYSIIGYTGGWLILAILFFWILFIPVIVWIGYCISVSCKRGTIVGDKLTLESGVIAKKTSSILITQCLSVRVEQSFFGSIFDYGTVRMNCVGRHSDVTFVKVKEPNLLAGFIEQNLAVKDKSELRQIVTER